MQAPASRQQSASAAQGPTQAHRCPVCNRTYEKADHLNRHKRSHENTRPYTCTRCPRSFNRADLLHRHEEVHDRHVSNDRRIIRRTDRAAAACLGCVSSKAKCDDQKPCSRCVTRNVTCESVSGTTYPRDYEIGTAAGEAQGHIPITASGSNREEGSSRANATDAEDGQANLLVPERQVGLINQACKSPLWETGGHDRVVRTVPENIALPNAVAQSFSPQSWTANIDSSYYNQPVFPEENLLELGQNDTLYFSNANEGDLSFWSFDFDNFQLCASTSPDPKTGAETIGVDSDANGELSRKYAAFKRSPWLWIPAPSDFVLNDTEGLSVNEHTVTQVIAQLPGVNAAGCSTANVRIDSDIRDRMLGLLIGAIKPNLRKSLSFPSKKLLNHVIELFFVEQSWSVESWIHAPTVAPRETHPEFLLCLVSAGSNLISEPNVWKFGLALQEVCWFVLGELSQGNNAITRELRCLQANMLWLDVALWSGNKRKMEIAESFLMPCLTMLRRAAVFRGAPDSPDLVPCAGDSEDIIQGKWRKWVERESFKRLALHVFVHDTQASIALSKPPNMFITEVEFSLPAARCLWDAPSAAEWRIRYLNSRQPSSVTPRFIDLMHDKHILDGFRDLIDVEWCRFIVIYGFWGQISAYREADRFYLVSTLSPKVATNQLWLMAQHRELYHDLKDYCEHTRGALQQSKEIALISNTLMMILHVSPEDLQRYAGKFGEEAARNALPLLQKWAQSSESRRAIFHAGQVLRASKMLPPARLRGFYAVALYLASLALWTWASIVYGNQGPSVSRSQLPPSPSTVRPINSSEPPRKVAMNEPDSHWTSAFLSNGSGTPGLSEYSSAMPTEGETFVSLENPSYVLKLARRIYRENFPVLSGPLPPLTENLQRLLKDLGDVSAHGRSRACSEERDG